ncbi:MAG: RNA polymerase sigma factor [Planctomycetota bacterium]|jgi:RNA polymerase sigma-70 factor (ECF subfamily)
MSEDKHLLKLLRHGDSRALRRLYEKYRTDLFTVALSLIHDVHAAEDCLQDVFARLAEGAADMKIRSNLKGYLISSVANRARDRLRSKIKTLDRAESFGCSACATDPVKILIDREESARLFTTLMRLPYDQREVFVLYVQGEMKFREIAELQNVSIKTVQSRYRYGIEKLQGLLEKDKTK